MRKKALEIVKNRSDIGAGTRGSDLGIDAIEIAAINKGSDFFVRHPFVDVKTRNESVYSPLQSPFAKYIRSVFDQCSEVCQVVYSSLKKEAVPLVFSGDHSSAIGTISALKKAFPDKELGVVWIDAHADIHSPYTTPSGNMHGMPLAALMHLDNLKYAKNELNEETKMYWGKLKNLAGEFPKLNPEHLVYLGVRDIEEEEVQVLQDLKIKNFTVEETRRLGVIHVVAKVLKKMSACDILYISFDVDSMDSELISEGTGTPVPKGFEVHEVKGILTGLISSGKVCCLEVVEVNPLLDRKGNKMAEVAFEILEEITPGLMV